MSATATATLYVRLQPKLKREVARLATKQRCTEAKVAAEALRRYLARSEKARPPARAAR
jgi:predicted transcriptional regulator